MKNQLIIGLSLLIFLLFTSIAFAQSIPTPLTTTNSPHEPIKVLLIALGLYAAKKLK